MTQGRHFGFLMGGRYVHSSCNTTTRRTGSSHPRSLNSVTVAGARCWPPETPSAPMVAQRPQRPARHGGSFPEHHPHPAGTSGSGTWGRERGPACAGCPIRSPAGVDRSPGRTGSCWPRGPPRDVRPMLYQGCRPSLRTSSRRGTVMPGLSHVSWVPIGATLQSLLHEATQRWCPFIFKCSCPSGCGDQGDAAPGWAEGVRHRPVPWGCCLERVRGLPCPPKSLCSQLLNKHPLPGCGRRCHFAQCRCQ